MLVVNPPKPRCFICSDLFNMFEKSGHWRFFLDVSLPVIYSSY